jgi:hypothetical protein
MIVDDGHTAFSTHELPFPLGGMKEAGLLVVGARHQFDSDSVLMRAWPRPKERSHQKGKT